LKIGRSKATERSSSPRKQSKLPTKGLASRKTDAMTSRGDQVSVNEGHDEVPHEQSSESKEVGQVLISKTAHATASNKSPHSVSKQASHTSAKKSPPSDTKQVSHSLGASVARKQTSRLDAMSSKKSTDVMAGSAKSKAGQKKEKMQQTVL